MFNNISMSEENMTIYFRRANGTIKQIVSGLQTMALFGDEEADYDLIWDFVVAPMDNNVRNNVEQFHIDITTKELVYTPLIDVSKYRIG